MRWKNSRRSSNVEDRRGQRVGRQGLSGGMSSPLMRFLPMLIQKGGIKSVLLIGAGLFIASRIGLDVGGLLGISAPQVGQSQTVEISAEQKELGDFVSVILADTEDTWTPLFKQMGRTYEVPKLILFTGAVQSACGQASAAMGPFYCPGDKQVYIDLSFYDDLRNRHGAPGDFAQAYVIAHEVGHHIQTLLGISSKVHQLRQKSSKIEGNKLSVKQELQADCFAGVWGYHADRHRNMLEAGDIEEAITAAAAIGDDRLQQQGQGHVKPESFTHGTSEQRIRWFNTGMKSGDPNSCDTFTVASL